MRLSQAASFFDRQLFTDAYGTAQVRGQLDVFDDSKRDGAVTRRRTLSTHPGETIPTRRALTFQGMTWLVGGMAPDYFNNGVIRHKYTVQEADAPAEFRSFAEALRGDTGSVAYAAIDWVKSGKEIDESSDVVDQVHVVVSSSEAVMIPALVSLGADNYLLRQQHVSAAGFRICVAERLETPPVQPAILHDRTHDPVSDSWSETLSSIQVIILRWQSNFTYLSQRSQAFESEDEVMICLKSVASPEQGDTLSVGAVKWRVVSVQDEDAQCWSLHVRKIPA